MRRLVTEGESFRPISTCAEAAPADPATVSSAKSNFFMDNLNKQYGLLKRGRLAFGFRLFSPQR